MEDGSQASADPVERYALDARRPQNHIVPEPPGSSPRMLR